MLIRNMRGVRLVVSKNRLRIEFKLSFDWRKTGLNLLLVLLTALPAIYPWRQRVGSFLLKLIFNLVQR